MSPFPVLVVLLCCAAPVPSAATQSRPDPLDARVPVPPAVHRGAAARPRPVDDPPPVAWPVANERVGRIGGWRSYARETLPPEAPR